MPENNRIAITSEIGKLEGVLLHKPGSEVENMTPESAKRALYSDILNLEVALKEYEQFKGVLDSVTKTYEVKTLLSDILMDESVKNDLLDEILSEEDVFGEEHFIRGIPSKDLAMQLIEGVPMKKDNLTKFLTKERFA